MKFKSLNLSICIFILFSCSNNDISDSSKEEMQSSIYGISKKEAIKVSIDLAIQMKPTTRSKELVEVDEVLPWLKKDIYKACRFANKNKGKGVLPDTLLYVVNFKANKGYAIVAADKRLGDVIAIVDKGNYSPSEAVENDGLRFYLKTLCYYFQNRMDKNMSQTPPVRANYTNWEVTELVGPLTWTEWHQYYPYNNNCPSFNGQKAPAGCVPIAIGQIMAYHHAPTSYNNYYYLWNEFGNPLETPSTLAGESSVASLIATLGSQTNVEYDLGGSGTDFLSSLNGFEDMGYHYEYTNPFSINLCWNEIDHSRPFFFSGEDEDSGHAWVVDGYMVKERVNIANPNDVQYQDYFRCNWGWGGSSNGFYLNTIVQNVFPTNIRVIYNIYPVNYNPS